MSVNIMPNPGAEEGVTAPTEWTFYGGSSVPPSQGIWENVDVHSGTRALRMIVLTGQLGRWSVWVPKASIKQGHTYRIRFWHKGGGTYDSGLYDFFVVQRDTSGAVFGPVLRRQGVYSLAWMQTDPLEFTAPTLDADWELFNTYHIYITVSGNGDVTADEFEMEDITPLSTGTLSIDTNPVKGGVYVGGLLVGTAPQTLILAEGPYTVSFGAVSGYATPDPVTATVLGGQTTPIIGTYTAITVTDVSGMGTSGYITSITGCQQVIDMANLLHMRRVRYASREVWLDQAGSSNRAFQKEYVDYILANSDLDVILDLNHVYYTNINGDFDVDGGSQWILDHMQQIVDWVVTVASWYPNNSRVWFEPFNEYSFSDFWTLCQNVLDELRSRGIASWLIFNKWTQPWSTLNDPYDKYAVSYHYYFDKSPTQFWTAAGAIANMRLALNIGLRIVNTEMGANSNGGTAITVAEIAELNATLAWCHIQGIGCCLWNTNNVQDYAIMLDLGLVVPYSEAVEEGTLNVDTTPVKGEVYIDGVAQGIAPVNIAVPVGNHTVGFGDVNGYVTPTPQTITVAAGQTVPVLGTYLRIKHLLAVNSSITGVPFTVKIEENTLSYQTPFSGQLEEGTYEIEMPLNVQVGSDFYVFEVWNGGSTNPLKTIQLLADTDLYATYALIPPEPGTLTIDTAPVKGEVFVNWSSWGTAPQSRPLPPSQYNVSFGNVSGYDAPPNQAASVYSNQTTSIVGTYSSPLPNTTLSIHAISNGLEIVVEGQIRETGQAFTTPAIVQVNAGAYNIEITFNARVYVKQAVAIANQTVDVIIIISDGGFNKMWLVPLGLVAVGGLVMLGGSEEKKTRKKK